MTVDDDRWKELEELKDRFGAGPTACVIHLGDDEDMDWPEGVTLDDISTTRQEEGAHPGKPVELTQVQTPVYRPQEYRGGVVVVTDPEIAWIYAQMPDDIREKELQARTERGLPIPPVLQQ